MRRIDARFLGAFSTETNTFQRQVNFFQGLLAEIRDAQQILAGAMEQIVDGEDPFFFETVRGANRQPDLGRTHVQLIGNVFGLRIGRTKRDARTHGFPPKQWKNYRDILWAGIRRDLEPIAVNSVEVKVYTPRCLQKKPSSAPHAAKHTGQTMDLSHHLTRQYNNFQDFG
jgi:hypothetical protein